MTTGRQQFIIVDNWQFVVQQDESRSRAALYWTGHGWTRQLAMAFPYDTWAAAKKDLLGLRAADRSLTVKHFFRETAAGFPES